MYQAMATRSHGGCFRKSVSVAYRSFRVTSAVGSSGRPAPSTRHLLQLSQYTTTLSSPKHGTGEANAVTAIWDKWTLHHFQMAKASGFTHESRYYGAYNRLLNDLFPKEEGFLVEPQFTGGDGSRRSVDFVTTYVVRHNYDPVLFLEIKPDKQLMFNSTRMRADRQMRERFLDMLQDIRIPKLIGLSAIGTKICIYSWDKGSDKVSPEAVLEGGVESAPEDRWSLDLLSIEGEKEIRRVVADVKSMCKLL